jgi:L-asparaginase II
MTKPNPILVEVYRGGELESFHRGVICLVNEKGRITYSEGDVQQICYPRSALKFFQVIPLIESGAAEHFGFTLEEIALMCGSHNGEPEHVRVANSILQKIGLDEKSLRCGPQLPTLKKDVQELYRHNESPRQIHNNCSGKHSGFLALAKFMKADLDHYNDPAHPVQQAIQQVTEEMYEYPAELMSVAVDGCSAPIYSIPVYNQALAYKNLAWAERFGEKRKKACETVIKAVSTYPFMVAGSGRYCTDMMQLCGSRVIGKTGAEGIYCLSFLKEKAGACIKIDDGKMLPQYNIAQKMIEASGIFKAEELKPLQHYLHDELKNYNKIVTGEINVAAQVLNTPLFS